MKLITCECACADWDKIGADVKNIPDCVFGGIHWFKNAKKAAEKWRELKIVGFSLPMFTPYYWAVHFKGRHVLNIIK